MDKKIIYIFLILGFLAACNKNDDEISIEKSETEQYEELFNNTIVLTTNAYIGSNSRTVGDGMPLKYYLSYDKEKPEELRLELRQFTYGNMPLTINLLARVQLIKKSEEKVRLYCNDATLDMSDSNNVGNSKVDGYFYPKTNEIEIFINYNVLNVTTHSAKQKIDLTRIDRYEEEMEAYNKLHKEQNS